MARESAHIKGRRLLVEARLNVQAVDINTVHATCRGDAAEVYRLGWNRGEGWWCTCPVRTDACAHLVALRLITVVTKGAS